MKHEGDEYVHDRQAQEFALMRARLEDMLEEHDAQDAVFGAAAVVAIGELSAAIGSDAALATCMAASLRHWAGSHGGVGGVAPWWPTLLPDGASHALLFAALGAVDRVGADLDASVAAAVRGALLLRLGAKTAALPRLNAAAAEPACAPETLVDLVVVAARTGDRALAIRAFARLRARAEQAEHAASLRWRRCLLAATAALSLPRPWQPGSPASA